MIARGETVAEAVLRVAAWAADSDGSLVHVGTDPGPTGRGDHHARAQEELNREDGWGYVSPQGVPYEDPRGVGADEL